MVNKCKLQTIITALLCSVMLLGCSNLIEDLKDQGEPVVPVSSIKLDATATVTVEEGSKITLTATVLPANATDKTVIWTSSDETVATVVNGVITGLKAGTVTITATAGGKSVSCTVTVKEVPKYNINWCTTALPDGKTLYELATKSKKIIFGKPTDYASVIADTATYTKYAVGETDDDLIYAYYKPNDDSFVDFDFSTCKAEVYILSEGKIKFTDNDLISEEIQDKVIGSFGIPVGIFAFCFYAEEINLQNINTTELTNMIMMFGFDMNVKELNLSEIDTSNVTNMLGMFTYCSEIKNLDLSTFNTSKVTNMSAMFGGSDISEPCEKLESINFGNIDTRNVTSMNDMFNGCKALKSIDLSKFDTSNVTNMEAMFLSCKSLTSIDVSTFNTAKVTNMRYMFCGCVITELDISTFDFTSIAETYNMFGNCQNLKTIYAKEGTDLSGMASITDSAKMFDNCTVLIGGKGTVYDPSYTDKSYARIDAAGTPGYFTKKGDAPYVPSIACSNCGTTYTTQALADNCNKDYGCPAFNVSENIDKVYYSFAEYFIKINTSTGVADEVWWIPSDGSEKIFVPASTYESTVAGVIGDNNYKHFSGVEPEYTILKNIAEDPETTCYDISYADITDAYGSLFKYTKDIKTAFPEKSNPVLPASLTGDDIFYVSIGSVFIFDFTKNKVYCVLIDDVESSDNQIPEDNSPDDLVIRANMEFPDISKAVKVTDTGAYQISKIETSYEIGKIPESLNRGESVCNPVYKTPDNKYFQILNPSL